MHYGNQLKDRMQKMVKLRTVLVAVFVLLMAYLIIVWILICLSPSLTSGINENMIVQKTIGVVPYPAVIVGGKIISEKKLLEELSSVKKFYESQDFSKLGFRVDFSTTDGKKRAEIKGLEILSKLIDDAMIQSEAEKRGIKLTDELINQEVDRKLKEYGTGEVLKNNLEKLYGWKLDDFKENIVKPDMYREKLTAYMEANDPTFIAAKDKILMAQHDLKNGMSFSDAVKKYSNGESAKNSGELGWFNLSQMAPEVAIGIANLDIGVPSEIIQSGVGYHIVKLEEKKTENNILLVRVSQIFVRTKSLSDLINEIEKKYRVLVFLREFKWNSQSYELEFRASSMQDYEKNIKNNPSSDPSMIF